ncbi:MAG TPA: hypothetical protein VGE07_24395 [Herpetosiphonaceae bacterium]
MKRLIRAAALLALALLAARPAPAAACDMVRMEPRSQLEASARSAQIIAVGEVVAASERVFTLRVEEYWKGAERAPELSVNNQPLGFGPDCGSREGRGPMVRQGARLIAFLAPNRLVGIADWQLADWYSADPAVSDSIDAGLRGGPEVSTIAEARGIVQRAVGAGEIGPPDPSAAPSHPRRADRLLLGLAAFAAAVVLGSLAVIVRRIRRRQDAELAEDRRWRAARQ